MSQDLSAASTIQKTLQEAQTRITELEAQLLAQHQHTEAQEAVQHYAHRIEVLRQIDLGIINANSTQEIIATALKHIRQLIPCQRANVSLIDMDKQELVIFVVDSKNETALSQGVRVPMQANFFDGVDHRKLRVIEDMRLLPSSIPRLKQGLDEGLLSALNVILMDRDKPIGTLWLFSDQVGFFTAEHQEIILEIGNQLAIAIRQRQLAEQLAGYTAELEQRVNERTLELQAGKAQVEALLNNSPNGILLIEPDLSIQQTNTAFHKMIGCEPAECEHRSLLVYIHEEDQQTVTRLVEQVIEEQAGKRAEVRIKRKNGNTFDAELAFELIVGDGLVCTIQDITERKAQERQLRYYGSIQASVSDAVIATDMELRIQSWNPAAEAIYGWTAAEAIGRTVPEILQTVYESEEDRQRIIGEFLAKGSWQRDIMQRSKDGRTLYIHASTNLFKDEKGQPVGIVSVNRDITERKEIMEALQKSSAEIHDLYNNAPCSYQSLDKDGLIIQINDTGLKWLGYSRDEVIGKLRMVDLYTPESVRTFNENFPLFKERGWVHDLEFDAVRKDGSIMHILLNSTAVYDQEGNYLHSRSTMFDITELRKAQLEMLRRENYYRTLASNLPLTTIFLFDSNLRYLVVEGPDPAFPSELMEGKTLQEVFSPEIASQLLPGYQAALRGEDMTIERTANGRLYEGKFVPVFNDEGIVPNGMLVVRDVTEERAAGDALRASEGRYRLLAENIDDIIMTFSMDRVITYMSPSCERLLGFSPEEIIGKTHSEFIHPQDYPQVIDKTRQAVVSKTNSYTNQFRLRHKDGAYSWYEVRTRIIYDHAINNDIRFISVLRDITERKLAEDSLRESEASYRLLAENITDVIAKNNADGIRTFVTSSVYDLLGYRPEEMVGIPAIDIVHPDDRQDGSLIMAQAIQSGDSVVTFTQRVQHKDGHYLWIEVKGHIVRDITTNQPLEVVGVIRDITERKRVEDALRVSEERYRTVVTTLSEGIVMQDRDGKILTCNAAAERILGLSIDQMTGVTSIDPRWHAVHEDGSPFPGETHPGMVTLRTGQPLNDVIMGVRLPDGARHWISINSQPLIAPGETLPYAVVATFSDITSRHQAEAAMRESEEKYRSLVETMHDGLAILDEEFHVIYVNNRFCEMLGYARDEIIGKYPTSFVDGENVPLIQSHLGRRQQGEGTSYELPLRRRDGRSITVLFSGTPLFDKDGQNMGSFVITTDITVQKQAQDALQQALIKEKELGELKTRFISIASHEFRTPLATLLAIVETLTAYRKKLSEDQIEERLVKLKEQIGHLKNIMDDVLLLSRMQARRFDFNPIKMNLDALVRSVLDEFRNRTDIKPQVEYIASENVHEALLDPKLMRQIINNLVSNAIKYSPQGNTIRLHLDYTDWVLILKITDEGIGIPEADMPHLFEPFHRAVNAEHISGTGLGLVITKEAVELHRGTIEVESKENVGTTFIVRIPISPNSENAS